MFIPGTSSRPPQGLIIPEKEQILFTVLTHIPFAFLLFKSFDNLYARADATCLLFTIGGVVASIFEPILDVMGFCYFPRDGNITAFELYDRPIPILVPGTYGWFVGGLGFWTLSILNEKKTIRADIWRMWLRNFMFNLILEYTALYFRMYVYYGHQPFSIGGFPLWFPACHAIAPLISATLVYLIQKELVGLKILMIVPIVVATYGMANAGFGWPVWVALSLDIGPQISYPAGLITVALIASGLWILSTAFPRDSRKLSSH